MARLDSINEMVHSSPKLLVQSSELGFKSKIESVASDICKKSGRQLVFLAGPSSSGKTTTALEIKGELENNSRSAVVVSLDDFYLSQKTARFFEDGTPDYETVDALDIELICKSVKALVKSGKAMIPSFDFKLGERASEQTELCVDGDSVIIVEGLNALNPKITDCFGDLEATKLYASVSSRIFCNDGSVLMSKRDLRFVRRLIRDFHHRNSNVENTFFLWNGVQKGEERYIFPYSHLADVKINTFHAYEVALFKEEALRLLDRIDENSIYYMSASALSKKLRLFEGMDFGLMPNDSLLQEFTA